MNIEKLRPNVAITFCKRTPYVHPRTRGFFFYPMDLISALLSDFADGSDSLEEALKSFVICTSSPQIMTINLLEDLAETFYINHHANIYFLSKGFSSGFEAIRQICISPFNLNQIENINLVAAIEILNVHDARQDHNYLQELGKKVTEKFNLLKEVDQMNEGYAKTPFNQIVDDHSLKLGIEKSALYDETLGSIRKYIEAEQNKFFDPHLVHVLNSQHYESILEDDLTLKKQISKETLKSYMPLFKRFGTMTTRLQPTPVTGAALLCIKPIISGRITGTKTYVKIKAIYRTGYTAETMGKISVQMVQELTADLNLSVAQIGQIFISQTSANHSYIIKSALEAFDKKLPKKINCLGGEIGTGVSPALVGHHLLSNTVQFLSSTNNDWALILAETPEWQAYAILLEKIQED